MRSIYLFLCLIVFVSCSNNNDKKPTSTQTDTQNKESELLIANDEYYEESYSLLSAFLDSSIRLPYSKKNLDNFMYPINTVNICHKSHQYIEDYRIDSIIYLFAYVVVKPKLSKYEIESDWTKLLIFKLKPYASQLKIEPSIKNRVYRSFWDSQNVKELKDRYTDYSGKWFKANIDSTIEFTEITQDISAYDLSNVFTPQKSLIRNGVFGKNYHRIQVKISSIEKVENEYRVNGKTKLKENIEGFHGWIRPRVAIEYNNEGLDISPIVILSDYEFKEKEGLFKGVLASFCYMDSDKYHLDTEASIADDYFNNGFVGIWKSNKSGKEYKCIWADGRLPYTNDFDVGDGEFCPNNKYLKHGWENFKNEIERNSTSDF